MSLHEQFTVLEQINTTEQPTVTEQSTVLDQLDVTEQSETKQSTVLEQSETKSNIKEAYGRLISDKRFIEQINDSINTIIKDVKISLSDVPEIMLLIMHTYNNIALININYNDLPDLIRMLFDYISNKYNLIPDDEKVSFDLLIESVIKLVIFQPKIKENIKKCFKYFPCCK